MSETKYTVRRTTQFKKDVKLALRQGRDMRELEVVIALLAMGVELPVRYRDHALTGNQRGRRECHVQPDWLLVYRIENDLLELILIRTGTHAEVLGK